MEQLDKQPEKNEATSTQLDTGGRLKAILEHYGLTAYQAGERLGYSRNSKLYKLLSNEGRPGFETLLDIVRAFPAISPGWLLTGELPMLRGGMADDGTPERGALLRQVAAGERLVTVDSQGKPNTVLVPIRAQAGYTVQHNEAVYLEQLNSYKVPGFDGGAFRAFEVAGDSMEPTINHRDLVVCSRVEELRLLEPGEVYVVVTAESVMLKRIKNRVRADDSEIVLYSDNPHRLPYGMETRDIMELWRVRGYISNYIPSAPDITVERLWEVIDALGLDRGEVRRHMEEKAPSHAP